MKENIDILILHFEANNKIYWGPEHNVRFNM